MEDSSSPLSPISLFGIALSLGILNLLIILRDFSSSLRCLLHFFSNILHFFLRTHEQKPENPPESETLTDRNEETKVGRNARLSIEEVKDVIERAETLSDHSSDDESFEEEEEEEEVKMEVVEEAFRVFDENADGFVDSGELNRVLCTLGFSRCSKEACKEMIKSFDQNGDGRIDFSEFVKLMEISSPK